MHSTVIASLPGQMGRLTLGSVSVQAQTTQFHPGTWLCYFKMLFAQ